MFPFKTYVPPCRSRQPNIYPQVFLSVVDNNICTETKLTGFSAQPSGFNFTKADLATYQSKFNDNLTAFDVHECPFQNFVLRVTANMSDIALRKYALSDKLRDRVMARAKYYAVASRTDVPWEGHRNGTEMTEQQTSEKTTTLTSLWSTIKLYDWSHSKYEAEKTLESAFDPLVQTTVSSACVARGIPHTIAAAFMSSESTRGMTVCIANFGSRHFPLRHYDDANSLPEMEDPAVFTTAYSTLELMSTLEGPVTVSGVLTSQRKCAFWRGYHIPPGGAMTMEAKLLETELSLDKSTLRYLLCGCADFRTYLPFVRPDSERGDYYDTSLWGFIDSNKIKNQEELKQRLELDIYAMLCTAASEGVKILVIDTYGMKMYAHPFEFEAMLWQNIVNKLNNLFHRVIFVTPLYEFADALHNAFAAKFQECSVA